MLLFKGHHGLNGLIGEWRDGLQPEKEVGTSEIHTLLKLAEGRAEAAVT